MYCRFSIQKSWLLSLAEIFENNSQKHVHAIIRKAIATLGPSWSFRLAENLARWATKWYYYQVDQV
jgi:hypothetical protein